MHYNKITNNDLEFLKTLVPEENFLVGKEISKDFHKDELGTVTGEPDVMMYVTTTSQVSRIMKYANEHLIPEVFSDVFRYFKP